MVHLTHVGDKVKNPRRTIHSYFRKNRFLLNQEILFRGGFARRCFFLWLPFIADIGFVVVYFVERQNDVTYLGGPCYNSTSTPTPPLQNPRSYTSWILQVVLSFMFVLVWSPVRLIMTSSSKFRLYALIEISVDLLTVYPMALSVFFLDHDWYTPMFLRIWIASLELKFLVPPRKRFISELWLIAFDALAFGLILIALFEWAQNNFPISNLGAASLVCEIDDTPVYTCMTFLDSLYWLVVTISTVGYGDVTPLNTLAQIFVVIAILFFILFIPKSVQRVIAVLELARGLDQKTYSHRDGVPHVVVSGHINENIVKRIGYFFHPLRRLQNLLRMSYLSLDSLQHPPNVLTKRMHRKAHRPSPINVTHISFFEDSTMAEDVVLQCDFEPSKALSNAAKQDLSYQKSNLFLQMGSIEKASDIKRCDLKSASGIFIFPATKDEPAGQTEGLSSWHRKIAHESESSRNVMSMLEKEKSDLDALRDVLIARDYQTILRTWSAALNAPSTTQIFVVLFHFANASLVDGLAGPSQSVIKARHQSKSPILQESLALDMSRTHVESSTQISTICLDKLQQRILGSMCLVQGAATLVTCVSFGEDSFVPEATLQQQYLLHEETEPDNTCDIVQYLFSLQNSLSLLRTPAFIGYTCAEVALALYINYDALVVGIFGNLLSTEGALFYPECCTRLLSATDTIIVLGAGSVVEIVQTSTSLADELHEASGMLRGIASSQVVPVKKVSQERIEKASSRDDDSSSADVYEGDAPIHFSSLGDAATRSDDSGAIGEAAVEDVTLAGIATSSNTSPAGKIQKLTVQTSPTLLRVSPAGTPTNGTTTPKSERYLMKRRKTERHTGNLATSPRRTTSHTGEAKLRPVFPRDSHTESAASTVTIGDLEDHIILCSYGIFSQYHLILQLRKATLEQQKSIVWLSESPPAHVAWEEVARFPDVYWMTGRGYLKADLLKAGLKSASKIVVMSDVYENHRRNYEHREDSTFESESTDKEVLLTARVVYRLKDSLGLHKLCVVVDLGNSENVDYVTGFTKPIGGRQHALRVDRFDCDCREGCSSAASERRCRKAAKFYMKLWRPITSPTFINGECWSVDYYPFFMFRTYCSGNRGWVLRFLSGFLAQFGNGDGVQLVPVPLRFVNLTYGEMVEAMMMELNVLVLGIFRRFEFPHTRYFRGVIVKPRKNVLLQRGDHIYVFGDFPNAE